LTSLIFKGFQPFSITLDNSGSKSTGVDKIKLSADWDDFLIPLSKWALNYSFPAHAESFLPGLMPKFT
jgi:hypothetical protein